jgi:hypothetical protein
MTKKMLQHGKEMRRNCLPDKASFNDATKQLCSDMKFLVWILREKLVFFEEVPQHAVEDFL